MGKIALVAVCLALLVCSAVGEGAMEKLKAKVAGAAPCDKAPAGPAPPRQFLDVRLPVVVDDYHPPAGGFDPTDIPSKEVDVAARKILREIQAAEAEAKANGDAPQKKDENGILTTEEHKALKQLLLDADILVRAASKSLSDNGPIEEDEVKKVAKSAVKKAAKAEKKAKKAKAKKAKAKKAKKPKASKPKKAKKPAAKKPSKKSAPKKSSKKSSKKAKKSSKKGKGKKKSKKSKKE